MPRLLLVLILNAAVFAQKPLNFNEPGPANLPAQAIGANDLIAVSVYDAPEFTRTVRVAADGTIRLPMLDERIRAEGLMPPDVEIAIAEALKKANILVDPFVTVTVVEYDSRPISVAGAVKSPITFQAERKTTLLEAITRAGGLGPEAGSEILVSHNQPGPEGKPLLLTRRIPVKALIDAADPEVNLELKGGEEIRVPEAGKIFVVGNVKKPGAFPVPDDADTTVMKAVALAEGLERFAAKEAYILRRDDKTGGKREIAVELQKIMQRKTPDVPLVANDVLYIPDNSGRRTTLTVLEKLAIFGTGATTALIYGAAVH
jgi:polysaccharide export outer membrane protein